MSCGRRARVVGVEARRFMVIDCAGCAGVGERLEGSKSKFESGEMSESEMGAVLRVGELIRGEHDAPHPSPTHSSLRSRTHFCSPPISHPHPHTPHNR